MDRNLSRRVEVVFPIEPPEIKQRLIGELLATSLADNVKSRELLPDGTYRRVGRAGEPPVRSQQRFLEIAAGHTARWLNGLPPPETYAEPMPAKKRRQRKRQSG
jgi:polyphosphate kinase